MHLFVDSLLHASQPSTAYQCSDMASFSQGLCLGCKRGRCNTLGYHIRQQRQGKSKRLFLATRAQSPFKGECRGGGACPALSVSLKPQSPDGDVHTASLSLCSQERVHLAAKSQEEKP